MERYVALGVLKKVPSNTLVILCARMVLIRKHNEDPRRTVDLQPLNRAFKRQHLANFLELLKKNCRFY